MTLYQEVMGSIPGIALIILYSDQTMYCKYCTGVHWNPLESTRVHQNLLESEESTGVCWTPGCDKSHKYGLWWNRWGSVKYCGSSSAWRGGLRGMGQQHHPTNMMPAAAPNGGTRRTGQEQKMTVTGAQNTVLFFYFIFIFFSTN